MLNLFKKAIFAVIFFTLIFFLISIPDSVPEKEKTHIRVANSNYLYINNNHLPFIQDVIKSDIDILLITEFHFGLEKFLLKQGFNKIISHNNYGTHNIALFTRNGWKGNARIVFPEKISPCTMPYVASILKKEDQEIRFLGVHLPPPLPQCKNKTYESFQSIYDVEKQLKMEESFSIIAGDFNSMPFYDGITEFIEHGWVDTYDQTNFFPGPTWSPFSFLPAFFRIDYIFVNDVERIHDSYSISVEGSDHRMVITDFISQ